MVMQIKQELKPVKKNSITKGFNAYNMAQQQFDRIADKLGLDEATRELLRSPIREYSFAIPIRMDDGTVKIFNKD